MNQKEEVFIASTAERSSLSSYAIVVFLVESALISPSGIYPKGSGLCRRLIAAGILNTIIIIPEAKATALHPYVVIAMARRGTKRPPIPIPVIKRP